MNDHQKLIEPLHSIYRSQGIDIETICKIVTGSAYTAVMLNNGQIGVCANFGKPVSTDKNDIIQPDMNDLCHRIILVAYYNALSNYDHEDVPESDILNVIDFKSYKNVVMIGFFEPLAEKFLADGISLTIFDFSSSSPLVAPEEEKMESVSKADSLILTSTSLFNNTFSDIINNTKEKCDIYMLGPSSMVNKELFNYRNIKTIFGSIFKKYDERVLSLIEEGAGTRQFLKLGKKIFLEKSPSSIIF